MEDHLIAKIIDANLDRAREGLRVLEDWCRFTLDQKDLVITLKNWRHQLEILVVLQAIFDRLPMEA